MNLLELELIGVGLIVIGIASWFIGRRNQRGPMELRWNDQVIISLAGIATISLITGIAIVLDGAL